MEVKHEDDVISFRERHRSESPVLVVAAVEEHAAALAPDEDGGLIGVIPKIWHALKQQHAEAFAHMGEHGSPFKKHIQI